MSRPIRATLVSAIVRHETPEERLFAETPEPVPVRCCARCRRGTPELGHQPCGYAQHCPCHLNRRTS